jgi:Fur family ferric uptake transcriptional regulator
VVVEALTERVAARLQDAGLRATRPRLVVAEALLRMGGHRTADEVHAQLARDSVALPRTSVYNSLAVLSDVGIALRADVGPGAVVYEIADTWHHHFVCRRCGGIADVPCVVGESPCLAAGEEFGRVEEAQVIFRGLCANCLESEGIDHVER